ncbi:hypothetical protein BBO99_00006413 [Phytophthora kernoviae]|uniref:SCP domain-containing protein n=1 Tax=Phytophthora kernoviae TaxID=325452 RepID=A0A3R7GX10_9STRA|nr:hypothetical protein JM18_005877 [Phytophthora kernoviae]RLN31346.1 hypothetical protein BBI17_006483 [Phytophthora kernoviae]RLN77847.1 hypothetical protein BBO99_00006413 [Phytophthora kernoviae]
MKASTALVAAAAAVFGVIQADDTFNDAQKALWIDRHNYFRMTALPWAAGNMRRIGWDNKLAKKAAKTAASCSAESGTGVNVFQSSSSDPSEALDLAITSWVADEAISTVEQVESPGAVGDEVGAGVYNSYSQVVWAETTSVGCAMSECSDGSMVVCEYSPAGNDGSSAWYVHAAQGKQCPDGTTFSIGLCVVEGDEANKLIAPIPNGQWTYQVYPEFVADLQAKLVDIATSQTAQTAASGEAPATSSDTSTTSSLESSTETTASASGSSDKKSTTPSSTPASEAIVDKKTPVAASNETSASTTSTTVSAAAMAGMIVLGVVAVAALAVFFSYRKNQQRQRDIMRDGGIEVI